MGKTTEIQYCDGTVNPTAGCDGCELWQHTPNGRRVCYAGHIHTRFSKNPGYTKSFDVVAERPGRMAKAAAWGDLRGKPRPDKPWLDGLPRVIFISDMADAMSKAVTFDYLRSEVIGNVTSAKGRRHFWMWFTKYPKRMRQFAETLDAWPDNLMPVTSVTSQKVIGRIPELLGIPSRLHGVSAEPLWGPLEFRWHTNEGDNGDWLRGEENIGDGSFRIDPLSWVAFGGGSGNATEITQQQWIVDGLMQCYAARVPAFVKQMGARLMGGRAGDQHIRFKDSHGGDPSEWPRGYWPRQMPAIEFANGGC